MLNYLEFKQPIQILTNIFIFAYSAYMINIDTLDKVEASNTMIY